MAARRLAEVLADKLNDGELNEVANALERSASQSAGHSSQSTEEADSSKRSELTRSSY